MSAGAHSQPREGSRPRPLAELNARSASAVTPKFPPRDLWQALTLMPSRIAASSFGAKASGGSRRRRSRRRRSLPILRDRSDPPR